MARGVSGGSGHGPGSASERPQATESGGGGVGIRSREDGSEGGGEGGGEGWEGEGISGGGVGDSKTRATSADAAIDGNSGGFSLDGGRQLRASQQISGCDEGKSSLSLDGGRQLRASQPISSDGGDSDGLLLDGGRQISTSQPTRGSSEDAGGGGWAATAAAAATAASSGLGWSMTGAPGTSSSISKRRYELLTSTGYGLGDPGPGPGDGSVVFLRSAREIKSTVGGWDSVGIESGGGILDRCAAKLREVMPAAAAEALVDGLAARVDVNDAAGHWWTSRDDVDTSAELAERMEDFFESMRFDPCDVVLVVGHSLFLQHIMRRFSSPALGESAPLLARALRESKLQNCGCVGLDVVFGGGSGAGDVGSGRSEGVLYGQTVKGGGCGSAGVHYGQIVRGGGGGSAGVHYGQTVKGGGAGMGVDWEGRPWIVGAKLMFGTRCEPK